MFASKHNASSSFPTFVLSDAQMFASKHNASSSFQFLSSQMLRCLLLNITLPLVSNFCPLLFIGRMIKIFFLASISAALALESSIQRCSSGKNGLIISGNTCTLYCCLSGYVIKMEKANHELFFFSKKRVISRSQTGLMCPAFASTGSSCVDSGYTFSHKAAIKCNGRSCYVCNNGAKVLYMKENRGGSSTESLDGYTLIRFG